MKWLHSAIRQLTNKHKDVGSTIRGARLKEQTSRAKEGLETMVAADLAKRGIDDVPEVVLLAEGQEPDVPSLRQKGVVVLRKECVMPQSRAMRQTAAEQQRATFMEGKAVAIAQILHAWGLFESLSYVDQEQLVHDILEVATAGTDQ